MLTTYATAPDLTASYDTAASGWHEAVGRLGYGAAYDLLLRDAGQLLPSGPLTVLDAGCGTGALSLALLRAAPRPMALTLLDPSQGMLDEATARLSGPALTTKAITGKIGAASLSTSPFDVVLCAHVLEHCPDPLAAATWLRARLTPGGTAFFSISRPHWCTALLRWKWGHKAMAPDDGAALLRAAGFGAVEVVRYASGPPARTSCGYIARA